MYHNSQGRGHGRRNIFRKSHDIQTANDTRLIKIPGTSEAGSNQIPIFQINAKHKLNEILIT